MALWPEDGYRRACRTARLATIRLAFLRSVFCDPLTADGAEISIWPLAFAGDPRPQAHRDHDDPSDNDCDQT